MSGSTFARWPLAGAKLAIAAAILAASLTPTAAADLGGGDGGVAFWIAVAGRIALGAIVVALLLVNLPGRRLSAIATGVLLTAVSFLAIDQWDATSIELVVRGCVFGSASSTLDKLLAATAIGCAVGVMGALFSGQRAVGYSSVAASALLLVGVGLAAMVAQSNPVGVRIWKDCGEGPSIALEAHQSRP